SVGGGHDGGEVIKRIRAFFKRSVAEPVPIDVNDVVREAVELVDANLQDHRVSVEIDLHEPLPMVRADRVELQQIILNLIMNGVESMERLSGRKRVLRIASQPHGGEGVLVRVEDS